MGMRYTPGSGGASGGGAGASAAYVSFLVPIGDDDAALSAGTAKRTFRPPVGFTLTGVRAQLATAAISGTPTFDVNINGASALGTKLTVDMGEKTSATAAVPATITTPAVPDDAEITIDVDAAGTGAAGAKIVIEGLRVVSESVGGPALATVLRSVTDDDAAVTAGVAKATFRLQFGMTLTAVRAQLVDPAESGTVTVDINLNGVSVLGTKLTIDATEKTSVTAAVAATIVNAALPDDGEITIDVDVAGTGAAGLKVALIGTRSV